MCVCMYMCVFVCVCVIQVNNKEYYDTSANIDL